MPNIFHEKISSSIEIDKDLSFIENRLENLSIQINEKQQKKQEFLLLCLSIIALLETPLHIQGIREILGIDNFIIYNSIVYPVIMFVFVISVFIKFRIENKK